MRALSPRSRGRQPARNARRQLAAAAAVVEAFEPRRLMASTVLPDAAAPGVITFDDGATVDWRNDGSVHVTGTAGDDTISVEENDYYSFPDGVFTANPHLLVTVNGQSVSLAPADSSPAITGLTVDAGDGNDSVSVNGPPVFVAYNVLYGDDAVLPSQTTPLAIPEWGSYSTFRLPVSLFGGAGNDTLTGGAGDDTLDGGAGVDRLFDNHGTNQFVTDPGVSPAATRGLWQEIAGGGYVGLADDGTLDVRGTDGDDVITADWPITHPNPTMETFDVVINGVSYRDILLPDHVTWYVFGNAPGFPYSSYPAVTALHIDGAAGDDAITVTPAVPYPATLLGGAGNDTLNGDAATDELHLNAGVTNPGRPADRTLGNAPFTVELPAGGSVAWDPATDVLTVQGTAGDDNISLAWHSGGFWGPRAQLAVTVNGDVWTFLPDAGVSISHIEVNAGAGNDSVTTLPDDSGTYQWLDPYPVYYVSTDIRWDVTSNVIVMPTGFSTPLLIRGGAGNDTLTGGGAGDTLFGGDGNDTLYSSYYVPDELHGDAGDDDLISDSSAADSLYGGAGHDHLRHSGAAGLLVFGDAGDAPLPDAQGDWYELGNGVIAGVHDDGTVVVRGTDGDDVIAVSQPGDRSSGQWWPVEVTANGVTRRIDGWAPHGGLPYDQFVVFLVPTRIDVDAGGGNDHVTVGSNLSAPTTVDGGAGDDVLDVQQPVGTPVTLIGGDGADTLNGDAGTDYLVVSPGDTALEPPAGFHPRPPMPPTAPPPDLHLVFDAPLGQTVTKAGKRLAFDGAASVVWRPDGVLVIRGTDDDDVIRVGRSTTAGKGKNATLLVQVNGVTRAFRDGGAIRRVDIDAGDGNDSVLLGGSDVPGSVFASAPLDVPAIVTGGRGNDTLVGGARADVIRGGAGQDSIDGGGGNDLLDGGAGVDTLTGGAGRDRAVGAKGHDVIADVEAAT